MYRIVRKEALRPTVTLYEIEAPLIAKKAQPGQFIILRVDENGERKPIAIGMFSPPFGLNLFVAQPVTGAKMKDIIVGVFPYLAISLIALIVITYVPQITLFIPRLVYGG